jgi:hypothetical protein
MRVIAVIADGNIIRKILEDLDLWGGKRKLIAKANAPPAAALPYTSEEAIALADDIALDAVYPVESNF